jgi:predicted nucleotidyltransferase
MNKHPIDFKNRKSVTSHSSGLSNEEIESLKDIFQKNHHVHAAILYGSRAKGNFKNGSDIDITLIGSQLTLDDLLLIQSEFQDLNSPYKMDLSIYSKIENDDLRDHIARRGHIFYLSESSDID